MYMIRPDGLGSEQGVIRLTDKAFIPATMDNRDWRAYQEWLSKSEANQPLEYNEEIYAQPYEV